MGRLRGKEPGDWETSQPTAPSAQLIKPGPQPALYLYSLYIARDVERLQNIYYCMYVNKSRV